MPDFSVEIACIGRGCRSVAGVDEAGRGCLAGPVVAAAVVLPLDADLPHLDDSKRLPAALRETLLPVIQRQAHAVGIGVSSVEEIERFNILNATFHAMRRAVANLAVTIDHVLVDGNRPIPDAPWPQQTVVGGDGVSLSIAAASVVAKVTRDRLMQDLGDAFPHYGFAQHKGYATTAHYDALREHGPCEAHRRTFRLA